MWDAGADAFESSMGLRFIRVSDFPAPVAQRTEGMSEDVATGPLLCDLLLMLLITQVMPVLKRRHGVGLCHR